MIEQNYNVLGIMSGTSLDGVDLVRIIFNIEDGKWSYSIAETQTVAYTEEWVLKLKEAVNYNKQELHALDKEYTLLLGQIINTFIADNALNNLDAICSHGHTILHQPQNGFTLQIGNRKELASIVKNRVVCDFRVQDVKLGGQGAPLVPIGDRLLFSDYAYCLNLGGFSNISFDDKGKRVAFDICPVNTVFNYYAGLLGYQYDAGGKIAASGVVYESLYEKLNSLEFYYKPYPKSLGFEYVKEIVLPTMQKFALPPQDMLRTFAEHVALQIANTVGKFPPGKLLITGGGAYNTFLIDRIKNLLDRYNVIIPDDKTIQYKEALIFALLGVLKLRGEVNVLSSVTGAKEDHSSGEVFEFFK